MVLFVYLHGYFASVYVYIASVCLVLSEIRNERPWDPLELEFLMVGSHHGD